MSQKTRGVLSVAGGLALGLALLMDGTSRGSVAPKPRKIVVTAASNRFVPDRITVKAGEPVEFVVHSTDTYHTFTLKESRDAPADILDIDLAPGQTGSATFTPRQSGTLFLYCKYHIQMGMTGEVVVTQ